MTGLRRPAPLTQDCGDPSLSARRSETRVIILRERRDEMYVLRKMELKAFNLKS